MSEKFKVLGVGSPMLDILVNVEEDFIHQVEGDKGGMHLVDSTTLDRILAAASNEPAKVPGGSAANTIFGLAELNAATGFLGKIGNDGTGAFYRHRFAEMGGDTACFKVNSGVPTGRCLSMVTPDSERTMRTDLGAAATLSPEDLSDADFAGYTHVHVEGYLLFNEALIRAVLKSAKANGCQVSLDLASFEVVKASARVLPELLNDYVDLVFANEDEARAFHEGSPEESLQELCRCCQVAAVKLGCDGALLQEQGSELVRVPAELVDAVDTTGAGDLWAAGFLFAYLQDLPLALCGQFGSILGAEVVKVMGASVPRERWIAIRRRLASLMDN